jgi:hypothetical protein
VYGEAAPLIRDQFKPEFGEGFGKGGESPTEYGVVQDRFGYERQTPLNIQNSLLQKKLKSKIPQTRYPR